MYIVSLDLLDTPRVAAALERRVEPGLENLACLVLGDEAGGQHEHVGVVVLAARASAISGDHATAARTCGYRLAT